MKVKIEFQNLQLSIEDKDYIELLSKEFNIDSKIRTSKSLSGTETLLIGIAGRIIGDYLLRLLKYLEDKYKEGTKIVIQNEDTGETTSSEEMKEKLNLK